MKKLKIKKGDTVEVIAGAEKGKRGSVMVVDRNRLKIKVQNIAMKTHFDKQEGQFEKEGFIDYSNVKFVQSAAAAASKGKKKTAKKKASASK